jgi:glutaredoxin 3
MVALGIVPRKHCGMRECAVKRALDTAWRSGFRPVEKCAGGLHIARIVPIRARFSVPHVQIYTSAICGYCVAAKNLLKQKGYDYEEVRVDLDPARREEMVARARRTSVPQIFIDGEHVGGFDDLRALSLRGGLDGGEKRP